MTGVSREAGADQVFDKSTELEEFFEYCQLRRQQKQADRENDQLRENHAATAAALRQLKGRGKGEATRGEATRQPPSCRTRKPPK